MSSGRKGPQGLCCSPKTDTELTTRKEEPHLVACEHAKELSNGWKSELEGLTTQGQSEHDPMGKNYSPPTLGGTTAGLCKEAGLF